MFHLFLLTLASGFIGITICFAGQTTVSHHRIQRILNILVWVPTVAMVGFGCVLFVAIWKN